jgi:hypothetical protein
MFLNFTIFDRLEIFTVPRYEPGLSFCAIKTKISQLVPEKNENENIFKMLKILKTDFLSHIKG